MTLLWENASPTSDFTEQTITVNGAVEYDLFEIAWATGNIVLFSAVYKNTTSLINRYTVPISGYACMLTLRSVSNSGNSFIFSDNIEKRSNVSTDYAVANSGNKPVKIYGIKGVRNA